MSPRYKRPCIDMPEEWRMPVEQPCCPVDMRWWEQFQDPVLNELIQEALASNYDLQSAAARVLQFQAQLGVISSQLYPQLYAQGVASRQRTSQTMAGEITDTNCKGQIPPCLFKDLGGLFPVYSNNYQAMLTASYELDLWGKIRNATHASLSELLVARDAQRTVVLTVVTSVADAYILLRQFDSQLEISKKTLKSRTESHELAILRFEEGLTSELEVKQAAAEMDQAALQVIQYETLIPQQENLISVLIGHSPKAIERGQPLKEWPQQFNIPAGLPSDLLEQRPDIAQAEERVKAANFRIGEARALYFPDLTLTGNYGFQSSQLGELFSNPSRAWQWMANLLQPLFTGWKITSLVDFAKARKLEAIYNYLQTILTALQEVNNSLIAHNNSKATVLMEIQRVKDLTDYLSLATLQYENGLVDYLNVLDAERRLFDAQLDLAEGQARVFITLVDLYKALGGGWVIDAENLMEEEWKDKMKQQF